MRIQRVVSITRRSLALFIPVLVALALSTPAQPDASGLEPRAALFPEIILLVDDTTVSPMDEEYRLAVYLTNTVQEVAGVVITIDLSRPELVRFPSSLIVETTIVCIDPIDCDPADTTIDTVFATSVDLLGSVISDWEYLQGRVESQTEFRFVGIADLPGGNSPAPIPVASGTPYLLFHIILEREASLQLLDTLQDRTVEFLIADMYTSFSDPGGNTIGLQESTICLDWPHCDSLDTVSYFDPAVNIYLDGAVTFGPPCVRGDVNTDGAINASDVVALINYVFKGGAEPGCSGAAGDVDCSGTVVAADVIYLVNYIFKGGPTPCT